MPEPPSVSALVAVRKGMPFFPEVLESILRQTIRDFEIVVAYDVSDDGTLDYLRAVGDARLNVVHVAAKSQAEALNRGLAHCQGEWIARFDADDPAHPQRIERFLAANEALDPYGVVATRTRTLFHSERAGWNPVPSTAKRPRVKDVTNALAFRNPISHGAAFVRREAFDAIGGYDERVDIMNDYLTWVRIAEAGWRIGLLDEVLQGVRMHPGQAFARLPRRSYAWASAKVQWRAGHSILHRGSIRNALAVGPRLVYGALMPHPLRARARAWLEARRGEN